MDETPNVLELDRADLYDYGLGLCLRALARNELPPPTYGTVHPYFSRGNDGWGLKGFYRDGHVFVNLAKTQRAVRTPGYSWSFPGYKADVTPVGVVAHETGHHVDALTGRRPTTIWRSEARVSSYEPDREEAFAESFKLFVTNPDLLRAGRPLRWGHLTVTLGLDPGSLVPWDEVLEKRGAHEKILRAAKNWVARGSR